MSELTVTVQNRELTGKNKNRQLRSGGRLPAVVYGDGLGPVNIQVETVTIETLLREEGENAVFLLQLEGTDQARHAMIKDLQQDPLSGRLLHIDFQRVNMLEKVQVVVAVELVGEPVGVRQEGGMIDFINREVLVECLPADIPDQLRLDVAALHIGDTLEAKDLELEEGVELIEDEDKVIVSISQAQMAEVEEEEEDEELLESEAPQPEVAGESESGEEDDGE